MGGGESGYIFLLDAMITEKRLNSLLRICVIGIELANKIHKFRERDDLLTVNRVMEIHLGDDKASQIWRNDWHRFAVTNPADHYPVESISVPSREE